MTYLEDAATELGRARMDNERRAREAGAMHSGQQQEAAEILREVGGRRLEIAAGFTRLAAIEAGLPPCYHALRPEPGQDPEEQDMPEITVTVTDEVAGRLAALTDPSMLTSTATVADSARDAVAALIDHAQQGVYRPGAWEHAWVCQAFGDEWLERMEPDDRPEMLSADGRIIFQRPRHLWGSA